MHIQLSLSFHCYLLYLLLNNCDRNDTRHKNTKQWTIGGSGKSQYLCKEPILF